MSNKLTLFKQNVCNLKQNVILLHPITTKLTLKP